MGSEMSSCNNLFHDLQKRFGVHRRKKVKKFRISTNEKYQYSDREG
jgi:hypothetical protein